MPLVPMPAESNGYSYCSSGISLELAVICYGRSLVQTIRKMQGPVKFNQAMQAFYPVGQVITGRGRRLVQPARASQAAK